MAIVFGCSDDSDNITGNKNDRDPIPGGGTWSRKADFPGLPRYDAVHFAASNNLYFGMGHDGTWESEPMRDLLEWVALTNSWQKITDFPGEGYVANGFSVGEKGYLLVFDNGYSLWEFNVANLEWAQLPSFSNDNEWDVLAVFSIGSMAYITAVWQNAPSPEEARKELWEWDQATGTWSSKAGFPGAAMSGATSFTIGNSAYIGSGSNGENEFWEWNQSTDTWVRRADVPGHARSGASAFSIGERGYFGLGTTGEGYYLKDFWEWNQSTDQWTEMNSIPDFGRIDAAGFSIGEKGYITGGHYQFNIYNDLWEFVPSAPGK